MPTDNVISTFPAPLLPADSAVDIGRKELAISRDNAAASEWKEGKKNKLHNWKHCWKILLIFPQMTPCQCSSGVLQSACQGSAGGTATQNNKGCLPPLSGWFVSTSQTFQYPYIWFLWDESHVCYYQWAIWALQHFGDAPSSCHSPRHWILQSQLHVLQWLCSCTLFFRGLESSFTSWNSVTKSIPKANAIPCVLHTYVKKENQLITSLLKLKRNAHYSWIMYTHHFLPLQFLMKDQPPCPSSAENTNKAVTRQYLDGTWGPLSWSCTSKPDKKCFQNTHEKHYSDRKNDYLHILHCFKQPIQLK